ncbi:hypothetical protein FOZ63_017572, partial [Perkinsus olseni]
LLAEQNRKEELARSYHRQQVENKAAVATAFGTRKGATQNFKGDTANKGGKSKKSGRVQRQPTFVGKLTKEDPQPLAAMSGIDTEEQEQSFGNLRASSIAAQEMSERFDSSTADF